ncbi:hypothetical protein BP00DRAFT_499453 [Aspergillus indologenus CBS 114.80]|uniref:Uncharacterized protein n=1 Tax=Aspergillus indologenus CBS 114.80 TaxID=1450541 RepID=A0A2V5INK7_9EURO|nr:hypothetical protein BP00DRAFT_499453 [Aspergillus indologenus CBS 114.80]
MKHWQMARRKSWSEEDTSPEDSPKTPLSPDGESFKVTLLNLSEESLSNVPDTQEIIERLDTESEGSEESVASDLEERPVPGLVLRPGWNILDYHLYLLSNERDRDEHVRKNSMYIFDGTECTIRSYQEIFDHEVLAPFNVGDDPQLVFNILPIINRDASECHAGYILGYSHVNKMLYARYFEWIPHIEDLDFVWEDGYNMYEVTIYGLLGLLHDCFVKKSFFPGEGILSAGYQQGHHRPSRRFDDPGMELVMTILFCQWIRDAADPLFGPAYLRIGNLKEQVAYYEQQCRLMLQRASARAWFYIRDGWVPDDLARNLELNAWTNDLYTYCDSMYAENGIDWPAPSLRKSSELREQYIETHKAENSADVRFNRLFDATADDNNPNPESAALKELTAMIGREQAHYLLDCAASQCLDNFVSNEDEDGDDHHHNVSIEWLARRLAYLTLDYPELDSPTNRSHFCELLMRMGVSMQQQPEEHLAQLPDPPLNGDFWRLVVDSSQADTSSARRLLPSPIID